MSDTLRAANLLHEWLINNGQGFRIESVGITTYNDICRLKTLSGELHVTVYEHVVYNNRSLEDSMKALYARIESIRASTYQAGVVLSDIPLPYISYFKQTLFAKWYIQKTIWHTNNEQQSKELMHVHV